MHHFSDASDKAYGTASYIRFASDTGNIHCTLLLGKARVAPLNRITTPRMELTAATLAVKLNHVIQRECKIQIDETFYWTDSMTVVRYVQNQSSRFHTFVANRLTIIHEGSTAEQWRFVDGSCNPADFASRGLQVTEREKTDRWMSGPRFLWENQNSWPKNPDSVSTPLSTLNDDPELKKSANAAIVDETYPVLD